jgi:hypothetical protein
MVVNEVRCATDQRWFSKKRTNLWDTIPSCYLDVRTTFGSLEPCIDKAVWEMYVNN